ncbi:MAG: cbb3-type cytochrome c oxidase N-terminal domain-containing protein [Planctomycetota bacterium]
MSTEDKNYAGPDFGSQEPAFDDNLMDHEYDGIREYDNPLPAWWSWTWIATIVFCIPYVMWFHLGEGPSIHDNLEQEKADFAALMMEQYGDLEADPATIAKYMHDDIAMAGMRNEFETNCARCHRADGGGLSGPNLTDDSWLHVGQIADIAQVISNGVPEKGMPSWSGALTDTQIVLMAAYVAQLREKPIGDGKAPQGSVLPPWDLVVAGTH